MARAAALQSWLEESLRPVLDRMRRRRSPRLPAPQVRVEAPGLRFIYGAVEQPFHTASVGKVFLAVLLGQLVESGRLSLDRPVGAVVPAAELADLPAADGVDFGAEVTVGQLLSHRSGLPDPFLPPRGYDTECSITALAEDLDRQWTPRDLLAQAATLPPTGRPGEQFCYSDAGFALLTRVAEEAGEGPVGELLRTCVFDPCGMVSTHQPHESPTSRARLHGIDIAPMWLRGTEVSRAPVLSIGSVDGGGVTTSADLVRFQRALHGGRLIRPELLNRLVRPRSRLRPGVHYGSGFVTLRFGEFVPGFLRGIPEPVGGLGLNAVHAFYYPTHDTHVVLNFHDTGAMNQSFRTHIGIARQLRSATSAVPPAAPRTARRDRRRLHPWRT